MILFEGLWKKLWWIQTDGVKWLEEWEINIKLSKILPFCALQDRRI